MVLSLAVGTFCCGLLSVFVFVDADGSLMPSTADCTTVVLGALGFVVPVFLAFVASHWFRYVFSCLVLAKGSEVNCVWYWTREGAEDGLR